MSGAAVDRHLAEGLDAIAEARWGDAKLAFERSLAETVTPEALDGLGRAIWWLGDTGEALATRTRAYTAYRRAGKLDAAARIAVWLTLECAAIPGREALARGWLSRAERLLPDATIGSGWISLARASLETDPIRMAMHAENALEVARSGGDPELEIRALARSGLALALSGRAAEGMARLDEAMTAAAAGESERPEVFAETCCDMVTACEATLDGRRLEQWGQVAERFLQLRPHAPMLGFCGACCGAVLASRGDLAGAERWLTWTIESLESAGHRARCIDAKAKLAEIRLGQGRLEEAERLLAGVESRPEATRAQVGLLVARGELGIASSLLHRRIAKIGPESTAALPVLALLVPVQLMRGDVRGASSSAEQIAMLAAQLGSEHELARADIARGRVAMAQGDSDRALEALTSAVERYDRARMPIDAARARILLAQALEESDPELAIAEARAAAGRLDEARLSAEADQADALVRRLGGRGRVGPKGVGLLTRRELEVLDLIAEGLTNAEIAERLFISVKTAGNHVSSVLTKLNLRSRTEAAAYAFRLARSARN